MAGTWQRTAWLLLLSVGTPLAERDDVEVAESVVDFRGVALVRSGTAFEEIDGDELQEAQGDPCSPGGSVWKAAAGGHHCGTRIDWLSHQPGWSLERAKRQMAHEFPEPCGACAGGGPAPHPAASHVAVPDPGSSLKVGAGFSLGFMSHPLGPKVAAQKIAAAGIRTVRLWSWSAADLQAMLDAGIHDVLVDVPTGQLDALVRDPSFGGKIAGVLRPFHQQGMKIRVGVGNEPLASWENHHGNAAKLAPAMEKLHTALEAQGMSDVSVTVPFFAGIMGNTYPPEKGAFKSQLVSAIRAVAAIAYRTGGEFTVHQYPWFGRIGNPGQIPLDLAVGRRGSNINGRQYTSLLHQEITAVRAALVQLDSRYHSMPLTIGESGWPSAGHSDATPQNSCDYARNALRDATRTDNPLDLNLRTLYLFEGFDETGKSAAAHGGKSREMENHFGLFHENGSPKCPGLTFR
mmetsp:Transcript_137795/g.428163  ORF Transcript_137795/g.428163 Transcript_137795/m.428163 type:complete len:461 (-) Transcript_137795:49-1431(-)